MTAIRTERTLIPPAEYLAAEEKSETKHEYLGGVIYAMAGASYAHNVIAANLVGLLHAQLRGKRCQAFGSDMKLKLHLGGDTYFYYPDAMVACDGARFGQAWCEEPTTVFEIISEETRRTDEREKRMAYHSIPSLQAYIRIEQDRIEAVVETRAAEVWNTQSLSGPDAVLRLESIDVEIPLSELYERLSLPPVIS